MHRRDDGQDGKKASRLLILQISVVAFNVENNVKLLCKTAFMLLNTYT